MSYAEGIVTIQGWSQLDVLSQQKGPFEDVSTQLRFEVTRVEEAVNNKHGFWQGKVAIKAEHPGTKYNLGSLSIFKVPGGIQTGTIFNSNALTGGINQNAPQWHMSGVGHYGLGSSGGSNANGGALGHATGVITVYGFIHQNVLDALKGPFEENITKLKFFNKQVQNLPYFDRGLWKADVKVVAEYPGAKYNFPADTNFLPSLGLLWVISNPNAITGGLDGVLPKGIITLKGDISDPTDIRRQFNQSTCSHSWKRYEGFTQNYDYCEKCDEKRK